MVSAAELQAMHEQQNASNAPSKLVNDPFPSLGGGGGGGGGSGGVQDPFPAAVKNGAGNGYTNGLASGSNSHSNGTRQPDL